MMLVSIWVPSLAGAGSSAGTGLAIAKVATSEAKNFMSQTTFFVLSSDLLKLLRESFLYTDGILIRKSEQKLSKGKATPRMTENSLVQK